MGQRSKCAREPHRNPTLFAFKQGRVCIEVGTHRFPSPCFFSQNSLINHLVSSLPPRSIWVCLFQPCLFITLLPPRLLLPSRQLDQENAQINGSRPGNPGLYEAEVVISE